jgi:hypothetical protein
MLACYPEDVWRQEKHFPPPDIFSSNFVVNSVVEPEPRAEIKLPPGSVYRKNWISYLMRKNEEIRGKRLGQM